MELIAYRASVKLSERVRRGKENIGLISVLEAPKSVYASPVYSPPLRVSHNQAEQQTAMKQAMRH